GDERIVGPQLEHATEMALIHQGARSRFLGSPGEVLMVKGPLPYQGETYNFSSWLAARVTQLHREGRDREALASALTGMGMLLDIGRSGGMVYWMMQSTGEALLLPALALVFDGYSLTTLELSDF